jgi:hypothetical protein
MNIAYREKFQPPTPAEIGPLVEAKRAEGNPIVMATLAMHTQLVVCLTVWACQRSSELFNRTPACGRCDPVSFRENALVDAFRPSSDGTHRGSDKQ